MKQNQNTTVKGSKVLLVPYRKDHVDKYHGWMQSQELQELTASEPLSLEEEYAMQQSWLNDDDKCTFIVLDAQLYSRTGDEIESMVGDVNLFFNDVDGDRSAAEVEIMIAEPAARGKGFGKQATIAMMKYGMDFLNVKRFSVKIGFSNSKSISLFTGLGFQEVSKSEVFREITFRWIPTEEQTKSFQQDTGEIEIKNSVSPSS